MIRLDKQSNQKDKIVELIAYTIDNPELELECLINNSPNKYKPTITHDNFIAIIKRFKGHPDFNTKAITKLNISFANQSKYKDVRIAVNGTGAVNTYCNNENLNVIRNSVDFEVKEYAKTRIHRVDIPNYNIKFNLKSERNFNNDENRIKELLRDISVEHKQYRYKKTFSFIKKTGDFSIDVSIVMSSIQEDKYLTVKEVKEQDLFNSIVKPDTVKTQFVVWWKSIENNPNERVLVRSYNNSFTNIKDSRVFTNIPLYEVEIEYIKNKTTDKPRFKNITDRQAYIANEFTNFFKHIGCVLQCVNGSFYILSNEEKYDVKKNVIKVIENSITDSILARPRKTSHQRKGQFGGAADIDESGSEFESETGTNKDKTEQLDDANEQLDNANEQLDNANEQIDDENEQLDDANEQVNELEITIQKGGLSNKIADIKRKIRDNMERNGVFFGPNIVDLYYNAISKIDPTNMPDTTHNTNIQINYVVTDKTDGERNLMFIDSHGKAYGIERSNNIKYLGIKLPQLANSIFDGEFVNRNEAGRLINHYYIFDCYIYKGDNVMHKPFNWNRPNGRHIHITSFAKYMTTGTDIIQDNDKIPLLIFKKDYLPSDTPIKFSQLDSDEKPQIFDSCSKILSKMNKKYGGFLDVGHLYTYKTDGLVFLPNNLGIFQMNENDFIENTFKQGVWNLNYKWKPADHLTIDFRIQFQRDLDSKTIRYAYFNSKKYITVNLISKIYHTSKFKHQLDYWLLNCGIDFKNLPEEFKFFAINPFKGSFDNEGNIEQDSMGVAYFEVDLNDNIMCRNNDFIVDGIICECSYDTTIEEEQFRWTPERIRADKTEPNSYFGTAITAWELINKPITKEFLSGMQYEIVQEGEPDNLRDVIYYTADTLKTTQLYLTTPLNKFNNFVKQYIISRALSGYIKPKVLDLGCGRLGDMFKYVEAGVHTLVGIDINTDNIYNYKDGAATRLLENRGNMPEINKLAENTLLLVGDVSKNIGNGETVSDNLNRYFLDVLYGRAKGRTPKLRRFEALANDGFDLVDCMYALHYMLNSVETLDSFLRNVSENLLTQGYFIGTCLDGATVLKEMKGQNELIGTINDKVIYTIKKGGKDGKGSNGGDSSERPIKNITVGNKITTFYETFSSAFEENLVNMNYIRERALEHNLKLIEYKSFLEEPISLLTQFEREKPQLSRSIRSTEALMTWARMSYYFIFQKVRDAND